MRRLGEILVERFGLDPAVLREALERQHEGGGRLGQILLECGAVSEETLLRALGEQFGVPVAMEITGPDPDPGFARDIPIHFLRKNLMVPIAGPAGPRIAIHDPLAFQPLDDLRHRLGLEAAAVVLAPRSQILAAINRAYDRNLDSAEQVMQDMHPQAGELILSEIQETGDLLDDTSDAPVIKLVNLILSQAVRDRASDIHIEPYQHELKVRYRVDGILYDMLAPPKHIQSQLVSRIKIMARMNIAEKRLPQDGRIEIRIGERNIDIRAATLPTAFGERVVLRLLDKHQALLALPKLGMQAGHLETFLRLIRSAHGIILVTGPTGSGKTTTLYAALSRIKNPGINIITIEDPIEYQIDGIGQIQVNPKIGLTFANGLRSIVRQDPDVILVGEIRDRETAEIAIHSALTGHLVFSTLHTNDSAGAVTRLIDMGIEPFLVSSSLLAIVAQRLVRTICPACKEPYVPDAEALEGAGASRPLLAGQPLYRGRGCSACLETGYRGRTGIFELLVLDDALKEVIARTADAHAIMRAAAGRGMAVLREDGLRKVQAGATTLEEVLRVTRE